MNKQQTAALAAQIETQVAMWKRDKAAPGAMLGTVMQWQKEASRFGAQKAAGNSPAEIASRQKWDQFLGGIVLELPQTATDPRQIQEAIQKLQGGLSGIKRDQPGVGEEVSGALTALQAALRATAGGRASQQSDQHVHSALQLISSARNQLRSPGQGGQGKAAKASGDALDMLIKSIAQQARASAHRIESPDLKRLVKMAAATKNDQLARYARNIDEEAARFNYQTLPVSIATSIAQMCNAMLGANRKAAVVKMGPASPVDLIKQVIIGVANAPVNAASAHAPQRGLADYLKTQGVRLLQQASHDTHDHAASALLDQLASEAQDIAKQDPINGSEVRDFQEKLNRARQTLGQVTADPYGNFGKAKANYQGFSMAEMAQKYLELLQSVKQNVSPTQIGQQAQEYAGYLYTQAKYMKDPGLMQLSTSIQSGLNLNAPQNAGRLQQLIAQAQQRAQQLASSGKAAKSLDPVGDALSLLGDAETQLTARIGLGVGKVKAMRLSTDADPLDTISAAAALLRESLEAPAPARRKAIDGFAGVKAEPTPTDGMFADKASDPLSMLSMLSMQAREPQRQEQSLANGCEQIAQQLMGSDPQTAHMLTAARMAFEDAVGQPKNDKTMNLYYTGQGLIQAAYKRVKQSSGKAAPVSPADGDFPADSMTRVNDDLGNVPTMPSVASVLSIAKAMGAKKAGPSALDHMKQVHAEITNPHWLENATSIGLTANRLRMASNAAPSGSVATKISALEGEARSLAKTKTMAQRSAGQAKLLNGVRNVISALQSAS